MRLADMVGAPTARTLGVGATALVGDVGQLLLTGDAGGNAIASITGGVAGAWLAIEFADALINFTTAAAKFENNEAYYPKAGDLILLFYDGTNWVEVTRSHATHAPTAITLGVGATTLALATVPTINKVKIVNLTGDAGLNSVTSITGLLTGQILIIKFVDALINISTAAAKLANDNRFYAQAGDTLVLFYDGTNIQEISRKRNSFAATTLTVLGVGATTIDVTTVPNINGLKTVKVAGDGGGNNVTTITGLNAGERLMIIGITATFTLKAALGKLPAGADISVTADDIVILHYDGTTIRTASASTNA